MNEITQKSEEERIREILKSKVYTFGEANILGCRGAAEAIYKEIIEPLKELLEIKRIILVQTQNIVDELVKEIEPLKRENYVLKQENRGMQTETNALQESINRAGNVISALQTRIQELEAEIEHVKQVADQWFKRFMDTEEGKGPYWTKSTLNQPQMSNEITKEKSECFYQPTPEELKAAGNYAHDTEDMVAHKKTALFQGFLAGIKYSKQPQHIPKEKSEEERIRDRVEEIFLTDAQSWDDGEWIIPANSLDEAAKAIYKEIIEPLKCDNEELKKEGSFRLRIMKELNADNDGMRSNNANLLNSLQQLQTRIQELEGVLKCISAYGEKGTYEQAFYKMKEIARSPLNKKPT